VRYAVGRPRRCRGVKHIVGRHNTGVPEIVWYLDTCDA
jgi:hypothetical protein